MLWETWTQGSLPSSPLPCSGGDKKDEMLGTQLEMVPKRSSSSPVTPRGLYNPAGIAAGRGRAEQTCFTSSIAPLTSRSPQVPSQSFPVLNTNTSAAGSPFAALTLFPLPQCPVQQLDPGSRLFVQCQQYDSTALDRSLADAFRNTYTDNEASAALSHRLPSQDLVNYCCSRSIIYAINYWWMQLGENSKLLSVILLNE